jgi:hypothetical protein
VPQDLSYEAFLRSQKAPTPEKDLSYEVFLATQNDFSDVTSGRSTSQPKGRVVVGKVESVFGPTERTVIPRSTMSDLATGKGGLAPAIQARFELARDPEGFESIRPEINKKAAPGLASALAQVALANTISPVSGRAADAATENILERFTEGGGDPGKVSFMGQIPTDLRGGVPSFAPVAPAGADLLAAAAAGGDVAGQTALFAPWSRLGGATETTAATLAKIFGKQAIAPSVTEGAGAALKAAMKAKEVFPSRTAKILDRLRGLGEAVAPAADRVAEQAAKEGLTVGTKSAGAGGVGDVAFGPEDGRPGVVPFLERTAERFGTGLAGGAALGGAFGAIGEGLGLRAGQKIVRDRLGLRVVDEGPTFGDILASERVGRAPFAEVVPTEGAPIPEPPSVMPNTARLVAKTQERRSATEATAPQPTPPAPPSTSEALGMDAYQRAQAADVAAAENNPARAAIEAENQRLAAEAGEEVVRPAAVERKTPLRFGQVVKLIDEGATLAEAQDAFPGQIDDAMWNRAVSSVRPAGGPATPSARGIETIEAEGGTIAPVPESKALVPETKAPLAETTVAAPARPTHDYSSVLKMTPDELEAAAIGERSYEEAGAIEVFGPEQAERYEKLQRQSNYQDTVVADKASDELRKMEEGLTPEQERRLFGIGETGLNAEELRDIARAARDWAPEAIADATEAELLNTVGREMATGKPAKDPVSAIRLRGAITELGRRGMSAEDAVVKGSAVRIRRGEASKGDQVELVRHTLEQLRAMGVPVTPDLSFERYQEETGTLSEAAEPEGPVDTSFDFTEEGGTARPPAGEWWEGETPLELEKRQRKEAQLERENAPVKRGELAKSARSSSGSLRPLHRVDDEGLLGELHQLYGRMNSAVGRTIYRNVKIEGGSDFEVYVPMATQSRAKGSGPSMQSKAFKNLRDMEGLRDKIIGELKSRGLTDEAINAEVLRRMQEQAAFDAKHNGVREGETAMYETHGGRKKALEAVQFVLDLSGDMATTGAPVEAYGTDRLKNMAIARKASGAWVDIRGQVLNNADDFQRILAPFRSPRMEKFGVIVVGKGGKILSHTLETSGAVNYVAFGKDDAATNAWIDKVAERAKRAGGKYVFFHHNHPSGDPTPSSDDQYFTMSIAERLRTKHGIGLAGHYVIDHIHGTLMFPSGGDPMDPLAYLGGGSTVTGAFMPGGKKGPDWSDGAVRVRGPSDVMPYIAQHSHVGKDGHFGVVYLNSQHAAVAYEPHRPESIATMHKWLPERLRAHGAVTSVIAADEYLADKISDHYGSGAFGAEGYGLITDIIADATDYNGRNRQPRSYSESGKLKSPPHPGPYDQSPIRVARRLRESGAEYHAEENQWEEKLPVPFRAFSPAERAIEAAPFEKGTPAQWLAALGKGVSKNERDWTGIDRYLAGLPEGKSVPRADVLGYLRDNALSIEETVRSRANAREVTDSLEWPVGFPANRRNMADRTGRYVIEKLQPNGRYLLSTPHGMNHSYATLEEAKNEAQRQEDNRTRKVEGGPSFEAHTLPGGTNYREILLQVPGSEKFDPTKVEIERKSTSTTQGTAAVKYGGVLLGTFDDPQKIDHTTGKWSGRTDNEWVETVRRRFSGDTYSRIPPIGGGWRGNHWPEANVLVHTRLKDRQLVDGRKSTFIEEIQSDWHQQGRKKGYTSPADEIAKLEAAIKDEETELESFEASWRKPGSDSEDAQDWKRGAIAQRIKSMRQVIENIRKGVMVGIPEAPFKKTDEWTRLALKRALWEAVQNGSDVLSWTTGDQQNQRYDLSMQVSELEYYPDLQTLVAFSADEFAGDSDAKEIKGVTRANLADYVGKEVAEKLLTQPLGESTSYYADHPGNDQEFPSHRLSLEGLELFGDGMKGYYDGIVPKNAAAIGKELGVPIEVKRFPTRFEQDAKAMFIDEGADNSEVQNQGFEITPALAAAVRRGMRISEKSPEYGTDLFGEATEPEQAAFFDEGEGRTQRGKPSSFSAKQKEAKERADFLRKQLPRIKDESAKMRVAREVAELDRIAGFNEKISADEMSTRAAAEPAPDDFFGVSETTEASETGLERFRREAEERRVNRAGRVKQNLDALKLAKSEKRPQGFAKIVVTASPQGPLHPEGQERYMALVTPSTSAFGFQMTRFARWENVDGEMTDWAPTGHALLGSLEEAADELASEGYAPTSTVFERPPKYGKNAVDDRGGSARFLSLEAGADGWHVATVETSKGTVYVELSGLDGKRPIFENMGFVDEKGRFRDGFTEDENRLGPALMRQVFRELRAGIPELDGKTVQSTRVGGVRGKAFDMGAPSSTLKKDWRFGEGRGRTGEPPPPRYGKKAVGARDKVSGKPLSDFTKGLNAPADAIFRTMLDVEKNVSDGNSYMLPSDIDMMFDLMRNDLRMKHGLSDREIDARLAELRKEAAPPTIKAPPMVSAGPPPAYGQDFEEVEKGIDFSGDIARSAKHGAALSTRIQKFADALANQNGPIERLGELAGTRPHENPNDLLTYTKTSDDTYRRALNEGVLDPVTREVVGPSFHSIFESVRGDDRMTRAAMAYVVAKRNVGRGLEAVRGDKQLFAHMERVNDWGDSDPKLREVAKRWGQFVDAIGNYAVKSGLWTQDLWDRMKASDVLYVRFKRIMDESVPSGRHNPVGGKRYGNIGPGVDRFEGSRRAVSNPPEALAEYAKQVIHRADRYRVGAAIFDAVDELGPVGQLIGTRIPSDSPAAKALAVQTLKGSQLAPDDVLEEVQKLFDPKLSRLNPVLWRNDPDTGRKVFLQIHAPELWASLMQLNATEESGVRRFLDLTLRPLKRIFTATTTAWSPRFSLATNPARDIPDALTKTQAGVTPADIAKGYASAVANVVGRSDIADIAARSGLTGMSIFAQDRPPAAARHAAPMGAKDRLKNRAEKLAGAPVRVLEAAGEVSDLGPRLGEYRAALRKFMHKVQSGEWTIEEARLRAGTLGRIVTLDFTNRPGNPVLKLFADYVPFFGVGLQGPVRYGQAWARNPKRTAAASALAALAAVTAWVLKHQLLDDDERQDIDDRNSSERSGYLFVPTSSGVILKVPLGQEQGIIVNGVTAALDKAFANDPNAGALFLATLARALPNGMDAVAQGVVPVPGIQQIQENIANRKVFQGRPVEPRRMADDLPADRRFDTTAPTFDMIAAGARKVGFGPMDSPLKSENVVRGVASMATPFLTGALDPVARRVMGKTAEKRVPTGQLRNPLNPASAVIAANPPAGTQSENDYYDIREKLTQVQSRKRDVVAEKDRARAKELRKEYGPYLKPEVKSLVKEVDDRLRALRDRQAEVRHRLNTNVLSPAGAKTEMDKIVTARQHLLRRAVRALRRHGVSP